MENTKIPKPISRPARALAPTVKNIPTTTTPVEKTVAHQASKPPPKALRRRSKSVTDLRLQPLVTKAKPIKSCVQPSGAKRPATQKNDNEPKPKMPKVKIPDWDYKTRFQELQKRHNLHVEELKSLRSQVVGLSEIKSELQTLRGLNTTSQEQLEVLRRQEKNFVKECNALYKENYLVKNAWAKEEEAYQKLEQQQAENLQQIKILQENLNASNATNEFLREKVEALNVTLERLKRDLDEHENVRRTLHNTIQDMKGTIRVFCRVRPPTIQEADKQLCWMFFPTDTTLELRKARESVISTISGKLTDLKQEFTFDQVFAPEANQSEVFAELAQLVQSALNGFHICVFAYGQTGSGKTYTMQGSDNDQGMIPRTIDLIFEKINKLLALDWTYEVTVSFLEIYNENIRDLLVPNSSHNYELQYNEGRGVTVANLKIVPIASSQELKSLMEEAHKNRAVAATDFNEHSSRSHAVTRIDLKGSNQKTKATYVGSINLVDLAGSESAKTTTAERLTETKSINKSLSTFGNVMLALDKQDAHVPYRNSKLTFLLQSCLGGNSKTLMFVNISPFEDCYGESINSLRFASKVKEVKTAARKNKT